MLLDASLVGIGPLEDNLDGIGELGDELTHGSEEEAQHKHGSSSCARDVEHVVGTVGAHAVPGTPWRAR